MSLLQLTIRYDGGENLLDKLIAVFLMMTIVTYDHMTAPVPLFGKC